MSFSDHLSNLGQQLDDGDAAHQGAVAARQSASQTIASHFEEFQQFLCQREIGPYPVVKLSATSQPDHSKNRRRIRSRALENSGTATIADTGWYLPNTAFVSIHGNLYSPDGFRSELEELRPDTLLPSGLRLGQKAYVHRSPYDWNDPTLIGIDVANILPISNFGNGERGRQNHQELLSKGWASIPAPHGVKCEPGASEYLFGVTHDSLPVFLRAWRGQGVDDAGIQCNATSLDYQLKMVLGAVIQEHNK